MSEEAYYNLSSIQRNLDVRNGHSSYQFKRQRARVVLPPISHQRNLSNEITPQTDPATSKESRRKKDKAKQRPLDEVEKSLTTKTAGGKQDDATVVPRHPQSRRTGPCFERTNHNALKALGNNSKRTIPPNAEVRQQMATRNTNREERLLRRPRTGVKRVGICQGTECEEITKDRNIGDCAYEEVRSFHNAGS